MNRYFQKALLVFVAVLALWLGYSLGTEYFGPPPVASAHSPTMPAQPHILYLASEQAQRGFLNNASARANGAISVTNWNDAQKATQSRALDALLIESPYIGMASPSDTAWLATQYRQGVVMVGLGVDDDQFAQSLGLKTFRSPGEAIVPIGETGYRLTMTITLGDPGDLDILGDWLGRYLQGDDYSPPGIQGLVIAAYDSMRGSLDSQEDVNGLFERISTSIQEAYKIRAEFATEVQP